MNRKIARAMVEDGGREKECKSERRTRESARRVLGPRVLTAVDNEKRTRAPSPGPCAKLLTANGHFVRDSCPLCGATAAK